MDSKTIRQTYLDFFASKNHKIVASAPIVLKNDPTLMFTNAGMNQFKDYFLGNKTSADARVADTQKCLRVSGKHNDLEEVGIDTYHHTMFEMLGNWSFGDYFKKEALAWSWELLTEVYQLPKDRIYVSVFGGDDAENLAPDHEAFEIWKQFVPEDRILYGSKKDNFWEMGAQGPCGPCSEIHIDLRTEAEVAAIPGKQLVNEGHPEVVEIWNNVFMQFNRKADGSLELLPAQHVDTGMGFERLCMAIQKKTSNYDTDVFQPTIQYIAQSCGIKYGAAEKTDIAMRVLADHIRAIAFTIADGQIPSNNKAGYVIRRILRRAVRYYFTFLGINEAFLFQLVPIIADQFENVFPELKAQQEFVSKVIQEEENSFLRTLELGLKKLEIITNSSKDISIIEGKTVFELFDTYGFPPDLTALIAREKNWSIDEEGFEIEMSKQKERSKKAAVTETSDWVELLEVERIEFVGYDHMNAKSRIVKYRKVKSNNKEQYQLVLDTTPFYAESGGQVGDTGLLKSDKEQLNVLDTKKENDLIIHIVDKIPSTVASDFEAIVDVAKRKKIERNHTTTHLLHAALKQVLGTHVNQKGSLVNEHSLRFDFSHFSKLTDEEIIKVEQIVNQKIRENITLYEQRNLPIEEAKKLGATALFGEKYGDFVRVITFDPNFSVEFCGGTHTAKSGQIGFVKIISESSVAAGVRRLEAITGEVAESLITEQSNTLAQIKDILKQPKDIVKAIETVIEEKIQLQKQLDMFYQQEAAQLKNELIQKMTPNKGMECIIEKITASSNDIIKQISFELKSKYDNLFLVLAADIAGKPNVSIMISETIVKEKNWNASALVKTLAKPIQGGGGGQPFYATAGGKEINGLDEVLSIAKTFLN
ncbi:MAG: alanine--tRNA ligase [Cytophagales bacterium]|nr:MAG: alanine--tRNA ligase [Cytophagales bacterium]